jgi:parvulin-like peptidyl-prolyl isomerase
MITMKRIALTVAALSVVAAGCSSADIAATVDDSEITESEVLRIRVGTEDDVSVSAEVFRNDLSRLIFTESMLSAAEHDFGLTGLDTPEVKDAYLASLDPAEQQYLVSIQSNDPTFTDAAVDTAVTALVVRTEVRTALVSTEDVLVDVWQNERHLLIEVCVSHVLVGTQDEAIDVLGRLDAGENLKDIANEVSLDTFSVDGIVACPASPAVFVEPFATVVATAPVGVPTGPVETEFGWHVIVIDSRESPQTIEELAADPVRWVPSDTVDFHWSSWLNDVVDRASIKVRSDIGMWYPPVDGIIPPPPSP